MADSECLWYIVLLKNLPRQSLDDQQFESKPHTESKVFNSVYSIALSTEAP